MKKELFVKMHVYMGHDGCKNEEELTNDFYNLFDSFAEKNGLVFYIQDSELQGNVSQISEDAGYTSKDVESGYAVFEIENGMTVVQKIDDLDAFDAGKFQTDTDAGKQARKDGMDLFVHDGLGLEGWYIVNNETNRNILRKELEEEGQSIVWDQQGTEIGHTIGESEDSCEMESCRGTVYLVQWQDGETTECCSAGMYETSSGDLQIHT